MAFFLNGRTYQSIEDLADDIESSGASGSTENPGQGDPAARFERSADTTDAVADMVVRAAIQVFARATSVGALRTARFLAEGNTAFYPVLLDRLEGKGPELSADSSDKYFYAELLSAACSPIVAHDDALRERAFSFFVSIHRQEYALLLLAYAYREGGDAVRVCDFLQKECMRRQLKHIGPDFYTLSWLGMSLGMYGHEYIIPVAKILITQSLDVRNTYFSSVMKKNTEKRDELLDILHLDR